MAPSHLIRASLCCAAGFSQASVESSTLLQATRSKFTAGAGSASGTTASELRLVETMATQMIRTGEQVSPEVKAELKKLIDESLAASKEQIKTSHTADITGGNTIVTNYNNNCLSSFDTSQNAFANSLAPTGATGLKHSSHKQCREQWRIDDDDRETKCGALEAMLASLRIQGQSALAVPSARSGFAAWWPQVKALAGRYDEWKQLNDACIAAENLEDATLADCNTKQGGFEGAMCSQRQGVLSGCEAYDNCYAVSEGDLAASKTDGLAGEASRKVEWEAIMKIECFVKLLLNEGGETQGDGSDKLTEDSLNQCKQLVTNTDHLDLIGGGFPVLPDKKNCVTSALDTYGGHPCEQSFLDTSYAGLADTNLATCVACATTPVPSADPRLSCGDDAVGAGVTSTVVTVEEGAQVWCNRDQYHFASQLDEYCSNWSQRNDQGCDKSPKLDGRLAGATVFMQQHKELPAGTYEFTNLPIGKTLFVAYERNAGQAKSQGLDPRNGGIPGRLGQPGPIWSKGNHGAWIQGLSNRPWMDFHSKTITESTFQLEITSSWVGFVAFK